ncbi:MAG: geranylgeranylglyceryl/heptaprenylglyceryl phosphate synthase [Candidatus Nitrosocosmicus sp.]|uniref:Geranylgeranylglyceryl phosphate synthase n=1 Tax=Candidatus Nitrosocosmicus oleophilus TaxID=1353260 RepID=A0A654M681_9ARCH|nr:geranylgeranylglyceryl/heptaprenylglyceryl phosphate synthase [Candidatus Nitrosocosmicus oleophilus]ALI34832.1 Heptaprenylglyceryl phosphate synthase [Candidatus Nitrosocosmicus oleophilus]MDF0679988.1 geranylgeranylglyceryl/heptaprenylglyceryl phosphate synthase [Candidatus Nitrosocosmicus sp.]
MSRVENYINDELKRHKKICFALLDSENFEDIAGVAKKVESLGASAILVGGSSAIDQLDLDKLVISIKSIISIPVILFPGNVTGVSPNADAILFTSLLNSEDPYFISGAQALGALLVKKYNIEPLPTGYIIIGDNTTAWFIGRAKGIPFEKSNIAVMYSLAAQYLGMRFVYLEAGSGAKKNVSAEMISNVRKYYDGLLIVGGGIKNSSIAKELAEAGADILVVGTLLERDPDWEKKFNDIILAIRS